MMLAAIDDTPYKLVLVLHIVAVIAAFTPVFAHPFLEQQSKSLDATNRRAVLGMLTANGRRIYSPALLVAGLLGFALQGMSDGAWKMSQTWMWGAVVVWIALNGLVHAVLLPAERALVAGDESAQPRIQAAGMAISVLMIVMLSLMVFKPGL